MRKDVKKEGWGENKKEKKNMKSAGVEFKMWEEAAGAQILFSLVLCCLNCIQIEVDSPNLKTGNY